MPNLAFEPGRAIVGQAGVTLYEVGTTKPVEIGDGAQRLYVSVDGGMSDNARPALYGARLLGPHRLARERRRRPRSCASSASTASRATSSSTPSTCPATSCPGDLLAVPATGAYCFSLASNYNYVPRPPVVAVRDGSARVIVRGVTHRRPAGARRRPATSDGMPTDRGSRMIDYRRLRVALLGAGAVGSQVAALLLQARGRARRPRRAPRSSSSGSPCATSTRRARPTCRASCFTTDAESLIIGADIVIELMGGIEPAKTYLLQAINSGADVVTANKALLATHGPEIFDAADQVGAQVYYEAAAAGAIPIIRPLRDSLAGDRVQRIMGIVNGTTNYILDRMDTEGADFGDVLAAGAGARLRRGRPDGRRRGLRRRAEGGDPGEPRLPHDRSARGRAPRGHHRRSTRR